MRSPNVAINVQVTRTQSIYQRALLLTSLLVSLLGRAQSPPSTPLVESSLQTVEVSNPGHRVTTVYAATGTLEAPNWSRDGNTLLFNRNGALFTVPAAGGTPVLVPVGDLTKCNGSHGFSPDGKFLAVSCRAASPSEERIYLLPTAGGADPRPVSPPNSYFHGWSPDGATFAVSHPTQGAFNIHAIDIASGADIPLTAGTGISDDPDFSPDGKFIYFNSDRAGSMQIWRMHPDGTGPEQITSDDRQNWTPHPSPDGRLIVYLSYEPGTKGHPINLPVTLRILSLADRKITTLVKLVGGSGTINVPSWSPDSGRLAFVSYRVLTKPEQSKP